MGVIRTDKWILEEEGDPIKVCERIMDYFDGYSPSDIYQHFTMHGMYRTPIKEEKLLIKNLQANRVWKMVHDEYIKLKRYWSGPTIPIFILPSDKENTELKQEYNQKSGLAFEDKLFLFVSEHNDEKEIRALFTHEYHHVCRLQQKLKKEDDFRLIDTIILEGLAEHAVLERFGKNYLAKWRNYYTEEDLERIWRNVVRPAYKLPKSHPRHQAILYGLGIYPKMAGYCVGFYLVQLFKEKTQLNTKQLLKLPAETIAFDEEK